MGSIFNIQKFCLSDGDGIRTVVFLKGCPLRCVWCHNPEGLSVNPTLLFSEEKCTVCGVCAELCSARHLQNGKLLLQREKCIGCGKCVDTCPNHANELFGREVTAEAVFDTVMEDALFYRSSGGGITLSGGEPSIQPEFALSLLRMAAKNNIGRAIETCGIGSPAFYREAHSLGTVFLYDIKCLDREKHKRLTGADNAHILENLQLLFSQGADIILRLPLIPGFNDSENDFQNLKEFLNEYSGSYRCAEIMPYHTLGVGKAKKMGCEQIESNADNALLTAKKWQSALSSLPVTISGT